MSSPPLILATKLYPPELSAGHVTRPRLVARLQEGYPLALISAPPGFGKTALIAEWQASQAPPMPLAWVALDPDDNDPVRFLTYVCTALGRVTPGQGGGALALLQGATPPAGLVLTTLINELADLATPCALVLDDYHAITARPVHEALSFLLDHLPGGVRLVLTSRADPPLPLARWRVRGRLTEIRAQDLRFTTEEAAEFLARLAGHRLTAESVAALERRTEGWIAGLQLAALALKAEADPETFVGAFGGSHRYVLDYLIEEVFQRQSPATQSFLLSTSILDRMCASLCDAVLASGPASSTQTDHGPSEAQATPHSSGLLEQLERNNLFVVALDAERQWYRYHQLFADALRNRLRHAQPAAIPDLHRRASAWYAANGLIGEAIHHALLAGDHAAASRLISSHGMGVFMRGQAARLARWLDQVPTAVRRDYPSLNLLRALTAMAGGQYAAVEPCLLEVEAALHEAPAWDSPDLRGQVMALRATAMSFLLDPRALALVGQAQQQLPEAHPLRPLLLIGLGNAHYASGSLEAARTTLQQTLVGLPEDERVLSLRVAVRVTLVFVLMAQGCLQQADHLAQETAAQAEAVPLLPGAALLQAQLGALAYERGDLDAAERRLARSLELARSAEGYTSELYARSWLAAVRQAQGEPSQALDQMDRAEALAYQHQPTPPTLNSLAGRRAYMWLAQGDLDRAATWATLQAAPEPCTPLSPFDTHRLASVRVLVAQGEHATARAAAAALLQAAEASGQGLLVLRSLLLLALAQAGCGQKGEALGCLERALTLAEGEGYVRTFLDEGPALHRLLVEYRTHPGPPYLRAYAEFLLGAFTAGTAAPPAPQARPARPAAAELVEPLSPRELEVLRLVADGHNNQEIAARLVVGVSTVKKHINGIFGKLGAAHRAQAIARARSLGLL